MDKLIKENAAQMNVQMKAQEKAKKPGYVPFNDALSALFADLKLASAQTYIVLNNKWNS